MGSIVQIVPAKARDQIGKEEGSHACLRTVYEKLCIGKPSLRKEKRLAMTFRAINDSPNAISRIPSTTLVFGIYPKIPGERCRRTMIERANIIKNCTEIVRKMKAKRTICDASRQSNFRILEETRKVSKTPPGYNVLVY